MTRHTGNMRIGPGRLGILPAVFSMLVLLQSAGVAAQPTNVDVFASLAVECVEDLDVGPVTVVRAGERAPYIRSSIVNRWIEEGRRVFADTTATDSASVFSYLIDILSVDYQRSGSRLIREVDIGLRYLLTAPDGRIIADRDCARTYTDVVDRADIPRIENPAFPETSGSLPGARWHRRYLEPVLLAGATAVTVLLFFSLRSKRTTAE